MPTVSSAPAPRRFRNLLPFLRWWPRVTRSTVRADAVAGLVGAIVVLPQGIAFATLAGMPPVGLLVNNASRFVHDDLDDFSLEGWAAHFNTNLRAPALLTRMFAEIAIEGGLIVNLHDAKLEHPNPDFFT